jgi:Tfp pilus assembly protein PilW
VLSSRGPRAGCRDERGFTLIETLVAMMTGMIVLGALWGILEVGLHQSARLTDESTAVQAGRATMTRILDELHSACVSTKFEPVLANSTSTKLLLANGYSEKSELPPAGESATTKEGVRMDEIAFTEEPAGNANKEGSIVDKTYLAIAGPNTANQYTYSGVAAASTRIGEGISTKTNKGNAIFTYYAYNTKAATGLGEAATTLTPITLSAGKLESAQAKTVAAVGVEFNTLATKTSRITKSTSETGIELNSLVTLAFSAPNAEATIKAGPCE